MTRPDARSGPRGGFTLLEVLVALIVLATVVMVALQTQVTAIKMEQAARAAQAIRFEIGGILTQVLLGGLPTNGAGLAASACDVQMTAVQIGEGNEKVEALQWEISPRVRPAMKTTLFCLTP